MPRGSRNYSLVINSRFRPFSYQEMLAPTMQATQAHQALEDAYGTLGMQAGTVEAMLNRELDEKAYNQYQGYMQGLQESADLLAREGLNPALRGSLSNLKSRYSQEIVPIQKAAERREKLAEEQRQRGNAFIYDFDASTTGLDRFMENPSLNYQSIDRKDLRARAENAFSKFQNELNEFKIDGNIDAYHKKLVQKYGYRPEEATDFINGVMHGDEASTLDKSLLSIYNNLYNGTQVDSWNNPEASREVMNTILEGVGAAIGKSSASVMNDEEKLADLKYRTDIRTYKATHGTDTTTSGKRFTTRNLRTSDFSKSAKFMTNMLDTKHINSEGIVDPRLLNTPVSSQGATSSVFTTGKQLGNSGNKPGTNTTTNYNTNDFYKSLKTELDALHVPYEQVKVNGMNTIKISNPQDVEGLRSYYNDEYSYDTRRSSQYVRRIDSEDLNDLTSIMYGMATDDKLSNYSLGITDGAFAFNKASAIKFNKDTKILSANIVEDTDGLDYIEAKTNTGDNIIMPLRNMTRQWDAQVASAKTSLDKYTKALEEGYTELEDGTPIVDKIDQIHNNKLDEAMLDVLQMSKTQSQTIKDN